MASLPLDVATFHWLRVMHTLPGHCSFPLAADYADMVGHLLPPDIIDRIFYLDVSSADLYDRFPSTRTETYRLAVARGNALREIWHIVSDVPALAFLSARIRRRARALVSATRVLVLVQREYFSGSGLHLYLRF